MGIDSHRKHGILLVESIMDTGDSVIGRNIRILRAARRLTQRQVANVAGITFGFLSKVESGKAFPRVPTIEKIARALGVEPGQLLSERITIMAKNNDRTD